MSDWYYAHDGQQKGPVPVSELQRLAANGDFDPEKDLVWREGLDDWKPAATLPELGFSPKTEETPPATSPSIKPADPYAAPQAAPSPAAQAAPAHVGPPRTGLAIASMVCGIIALLGFCLWCLAIPLGIVAVVLGHVSLAKIKSDPAGNGGGGMAKTGLITGYLAVIASVLITAWAATLTPEKIEQMDWMPEESKQQLREQIEARERMQQGN